MTMWVQFLGHSYLIWVKPREEGYAADVVDEEVKAVASRREGFSTWAEAFAWGAGVIYGRELERDVYE